MSHSDNNKGEIDILDFLTNKIDELLCQAALTNLQNVSYTLPHIRKTTSF